MVKTSTIDTTTSHSIASWRLVLNDREILNSRDIVKQPGKKWAFVEIERKKLSANDTFHFEWHTDVVIGVVENHLKLFLGKNRKAPILISAETGPCENHYGKFAADRLLYIADSISTNQLYLRFVIREYKPPEIITIKLKD